MLKIYLDQKDYIRIAWGILGDPKYQEDLDVYNFLLPLVRSETIKIFYSWCHLKEASGFNQSDSDYLDKYIEVLLSLTNSNCVKDHAELTEIEIEILLAHKFGFSTDFNNLLYPFGERGDLGISKIDDGFEEKIIGHRLSKQEKTRIKNLRRQDFDFIRNSIPGTEDFTNNEIILLIAGKNSPERFKIVKKYLDNVFDFKSFIKKYSKLGPFQNYFNFRNSKADEMIDFILRYQDELSSKGKSISESKITDIFIKQVVEQFEYFIRKLSDKHNFQVEEAKQHISESIHKIKSMYSYIQIFKEYVKRHRGSKKPNKTDYMDIHHMRYLPYVDCFISDRFFAEVAKNISGTFDTKVLKNLKELKVYLNQRQLEGGYAILDELAGFCESDRMDASVNHNAIIYNPGSKN